MLESNADPTIEDRWGYDLAWMIEEFGDRGMERGGEQHGWYLKVIDKLTSLGLLE